MHRKFPIYLIGMILAGSFHTAQAQQGCRPNPYSINIYLDKKPLTSSTPANAVPGTALSEWSTPVTANGFKDLGSGCNVKDTTGKDYLGKVHKTLIISSPKQVGTFMENGVIHAIYSTDDISVGYAVKITETITLLDGGKSTNIAAHPNLEFKSDDPIDSVSYSIETRYVATGERMVSNKNFSVPLAQTISTAIGVKVSNASGIGPIIAYDNWIPFYIHIQPATNKIATARGCTMENVPVVTLPQAIVNSFKGVGSESPQSHAFSITLKCDHTVKVLAGMSDANDTDNRTNLLSTTGSAKGLALRIYRDGPQAGAVSFGPDKSTSAENYPHRWLLGTSGADPTGVHTLVQPFTVRYVQKGTTVKPGTLEAKAHITFSYQ